MGIQLHYTAGDAISAAIARGRCLRRLPHVFNRVIELPLSADADVSIDEGPDVFRFVAYPTGAVNGGVRAHVIRIHPGVIKLVVAAGGPGPVRDDLELNRWRFRLPESARPELASAVCVNGRLVVTVPKGGEEEVREEGGIWRKGLEQRIVAVQ